MGAEDWKVTITSSHRGALSRQVTEAVLISKEGLDNLLNRKTEFGANNITELALKQGMRVILPSVKRKREEETEPDRQTVTPKTRGKTIKKKEIRLVRTIPKINIKRDVPVIGEVEKPAKLGNWEDENEEKCEATKKIKMEGEGGTWGMVRPKVPQQVLHYEGMDAPSLRKECYRRKLTGVSRLNKLKMKEKLENDDKSKRQQMTLRLGKTMHGAARREQGGGEEVEGGPSPVPGQGQAGRGEGEPKEARQSEDCVSTTVSGDIRELDDRADGG